MSSSRIFFVNLRTSYGVPRVVPLCAYARRLAWAKGRHRKTIDEDTLAEAREQGWSVVEYVDGVPPAAMA